MCNKNSNTTSGGDNGGASTARMQTRSMIKKLTQQNNNTTKASLNARRTRTKTRKPKYLSLLRLEPPPGISKTTTTQKSQRHKQPRKQQQPQHMHEEKTKLLHMHEHEEKDMHEHEDNNVAFLFESSYSSATTLNELLSCNGGETTTTTTTTDDGFGYRGRGRESDGACSTLVRTAMKGKERDVNEEKWVVYSEVVEKKDEEVTSCNNSVGGGLCLKLDYEEILNAWSDKGSLYIEGENQSESPQTVPDLFPISNSNVSMDGWGSIGNIWMVPDVGGGSLSGLKVKREVEGESFTMGRREASVLRYKEKRQSRLFSKRIRYEVRKLNAEKRPRMKGRFVKRS